MIGRPGSDPTPIPNLRVFDSAPFTVPIRRWRQISGCQDARETLCNGFCQNMLSKGEYVESSLPAYLHSREASSL